MLVPQHRSKAHMGRRGRRLFTPPVYCSMIAFVVGSEALVQLTGQRSSGWRRRRSIASSSPGETPRANLDRDEYLTEAELYTSKAEKLLLQAEKLRLEAARDELLLQKERLLEQQEAIKNEDKSSAPVAVQVAAESRNRQIGVVSELSRSASDTMQHALPHAPETMTLDAARDIEERVSKALSPKVYAIRSVEWCSSGVVFRGSLRGVNKTAEMLSTCNTAVDSTRYRFFWVQDALEIEEFEAWMQRVETEASLAEVWDGLLEFAPIKPPALVCVDASITAPWQPLNQPARIAMAVASAATLTLYACGSGVLNDRLLADPELLLTRAALPVSACVLFIELCHQTAHFAVAARRGVEWSVLGIPLPSLPTGLLGIVNRLERHAPSRQALFDVALAGPAAGIAASLACLLLGASIETSPLAAPLLPADLVRRSCLASLLFAAATGGSPIEPHSMLALDPLFVAGLAGLISNAYNLLPLGRADGGRLTTASLGKLLGSTVLETFKFAASIGALITGNNLLLLHVFYIVALHNQDEIVCEDDLTPPAASSRSVHAILLAIAFLALLPLPSELLKTDLGTAATPAAALLQAADDLSTMLPSGFPNIS